MYIREEQARECLISSYDRGLMAKNDKKKSCALQHNSTVWQYRSWSLKEGILKFWLGINIGPLTFGC